MGLDWFAVWIGRVVMVAGGLAVATCLFWLAAEYAWRVMGYARNFKDVDEACREWRKRHPEKYAIWKRRNGVE